MNRKALLAALLGICCAFLCCPQSGAAQDDLAAEADVEAAATVKLDDFEADFSLEAYDLPRTEPARSWVAALTHARSEPEQALVDRLARQHGTTLQYMARLIDLWRSMQPSADQFGDLTDAEHRAALGRFAAFQGRYGGSELVLAAAASLDRNGGHCDVAAYAPLVAGWDDVGLAWWIIAEAGGECPSLYRQAAEASADNGFAVIARIGNYGWLPRQSGIDMLTYLTSDAVLDRIDADVRPALAAGWRRDLINTMVESGRHADAVRVFDALTPSERQDLFDRIQPLATVRFGNRRLLIDDDDPQAALRSNQSQVTWLRQSLALAGATIERRDLAGAYLPADQVEAVDRWLACENAGRGTPAAPCEPPRLNGLHDLFNIGLVRQWLNGGTADPFFLYELNAGDTDPFSPSTARLACRLFGTDDVARRHCGTPALSYDYGDADDMREARAAVAAAILPDFAQTQQRIATVEEIRWPASWYRRAVIDPEPTQFVEAPVPAPYRTPSSAEDGGDRFVWPSSMAQLPAGYWPLRLWRDRQQVVAVSASQALDPTGEVTPGGYWIHMSDDGGRTWAAPLYTGLAAYFPYVIDEDSRLPMIEGDTLHLAVKVRLIDTSTIIYPPVATGFRRSEDNLFLVIPLEDLRRDSDADGWTDIAERRIFDIPDGSRPFLVGSDGDRCHDRLGDPLIRAMQLILQRRFADAAGMAIMVEPRIDQEAAPDPLAAAVGSGRFGGGLPPEPIVMAVGDPARFACLQSDVPILVYSPQMIAQIAGRRPDFQPISLELPIFNRAGTRGIVA